MTTSLIRITCTDGELSVRGDVKNRWEVFDNRLEGVIADEEDRSNIVVPFSLFQMTGWYRIDEYCRRVEKGEVPFTFSKLDVSEYSPICRFMDSKDGLFWIFLTITESNEQERREAYLAICNVLKKMEGRLSMKGTNGVYTCNFSDRSRSVVYNTEMDDFSPAVRLIQTGLSDDDYLFGSARLYTTKRKLHDMVITIASMLPRPDTMECRMRVLGVLSKFERGNRGIDLPEFESYSLVNQLFAITPPVRLHRSKKIRNNALLKQSGLSLMTGCKILSTDAWISPWFFFNTNNYSVIMKIPAMNPRRLNTMVEYIGKANIIPAIRSETTHRRSNGELQCILNICRLHLSFAKGGKRLNYFMQCLEKVLKE